MVVVFFVLFFPYVRTLSSCFHSFWWAICSLSVCVFLQINVFFLCLALVFLFIIGFNMPWYSFLHVSGAWHSLGFLNLWIYVLFIIRNRSGIVFSNSFFLSQRPCLFLRTPVTYVMLPKGFLQLTAFTLFILFWYFFLYFILNSCYHSFTKIVLCNVCSVIYPNHYIFISLNFEYF